MPCDWPSSTTLVGSGSPRLPPCTGPSTGLPPSPCPCIQAPHLGSPAAMPSATGPLARKASRVATSTSSRHHWGQTTRMWHPFSPARQPRHVASAFLLPPSRTSMKAPERTLMPPAPHIMPVIIASLGAKPSASKDTRMLFAATLPGLWNLDFSKGGDFQPCSCDL